MWFCISRALVGSVKYAAHYIYLITAVFRYYFEWRMDSKLILSVFMCVAQNQWNMKLPQWSRRKNSNSTHGSVDGRLVIFYAARRSLDNSPRPIPCCAKPLAHLHNLISLLLGNQSATLPRTAHGWNILITAECGFRWRGTGPTADNRYQFLVNELVADAIIFLLTSRNRYISGVM
jgi:hypothetical protein